MLNLVTCSLTDVALAGATAAEAATRPAEGSATGKKLIEFGWDEPDTAFKREHTAQMDATPFDGCVYPIRRRQPDGKDADFLWSCWRKQAWWAKTPSPHWTRRNVSLVTSQSRLQERDQKGKIGCHRACNRVW